jgi:hypothetical protein
MNGEPTSQEQINLKQSVNLMEAYLKEGELNPEIVATYKGFLRIFAAWIFDESLPWTTGEAPTLQMLFKYLKVTYPLPSDTTVRNQLVHIFAELHGKVVREFSVRTFSKCVPVRIHILFPGYHIQDCVCNGYVDDSTNGVYVCMHHWMFHQQRLGNYRARCRLQATRRQGAPRIVSICMAARHSLTAQAKLVASIR